MDFLTNQYLIIRDENGEVKNRCKWNWNEYQLIKYQNIKSNLFGVVKPYNSEVYQQLALDSLSENKITMIKGPEVIGKSYLANVLCFGCLKNIK